MIRYNKILDTKERPYHILDEKPLSKALTIHYVRVDVAYAEVGLAKALTKFPEPSRKQPEAVLLPAVRRVAHEEQGAVAGIDKFAHYGHNRDAHAAVVGLYGALLTYERGCEQGKAVVIHLGESYLEHGAGVGREGVLVIQQTVWIRI